MTIKDSPTLCHNCLKVDDKLELTNPIELQRYLSGQKSIITKKDFKKYKMAYDSVHEFFVCNSCRALTAHHSSKPLYWNTCSKCGQLGLNTQEQEKHIQKITIERYEEDGEIKSKQTMKIIKNPDQQPIICKKCKHEEKDNDGRLY